MIRPLLLFLLAAGAASCFRPEVRETVLQLPGVTRAKELQALRTWLLKREADLPESARTILDVSVHRDPARLRIHFRASEAGVRNIEDLLHSRGYHVNDLPGDPQARAAFRGQTLFR